MYVIFENTFRIMGDYTKCLNGSCRLRYDDIYPSIDVQYVFLLQRYSRNSRGIFGNFKHERIKVIFLFYGGNLFVSLKFLWDWI